MHVSVHNCNNDKKSCSVWQGVVGPLRLMLMSASLHQEKLIYNNSVESGLPIAINHLM